MRRKKRWFILLILLGSAAAYVINATGWLDDDMTKLT